VNYAPALQEVSLVPSFRIIYEKISDLMVHLYTSSTSFGLRTNLLGGLMKSKTIWIIILYETDI